MGKTQTPHFYDFGIWGRATAPKTNYFYSGDIRILNQNRESSPGHLENIICKTLKTSEIPPLKKRNRRAPTNPEDPSNTILEIFDLKSISVKKHEMDTW